MNLSKVYFTLINEYDYITLLASLSSSFDSKKSTSYIQTHENQTIKYGLGNVVTQIGIESISLNSLTIQNQSFGEVIKQMQFPENFFIYSSVILKKSII